MLPKAFRCRAFIITHSLNHDGIKSLRYLIKQRCYWPSINKDIKDWVIQYSNCQLVKSKCHTKAPFVSYAIATEALSEINVNLIESLSESRGHRYIFTICNPLPKPVSRLHFPIQRVTQLPHTVFFKS